MKSSLAFTGGLTCSVAVTNLEKAIIWYNTVLGFELVYKLEDLGWCEMKTEVEKVNIGLSQTEKVAQVQAGATLTFGVKDIDIARKQLEKAGVRFDGATREISGMVKLATFFDPDGNAFMLYQDIPES